MTYKGWMELDLHPSPNAHKNPFLLSLNIFYLQKYKPGIEKIAAANKNESIERSHYADTKTRF
jgi:hypothetical protein